VWKEGFGFIYSVVNCGCKNMEEGQLPGSRGEGTGIMEIESDLR
jgi:hypothetical protein